MPIAKWFLSICLATIQVLFHDYLYPNASIVYASALSAMPEVRQREPCRSAGHVALVSFD